jgi:hypothetical protein
MVETQNLASLQKPQRHQIIPILNWRINNGTLREIFRNMETDLKAGQTYIAPERY